MIRDDQKIYRGGIKEMLIDSVLLEQFQKEILAQGEEATLPSNLPQNWLDILSLALEKILSTPAANALTLLLPEDTPSKLIIAAITPLLKAKEERDLPITLEEKENPFHTVRERYPITKKILESYRMELAFEAISRTRDIAINSASIETIFTNREVIIVHKH